MSEKIIAHHDIQNKQLKEENKKLNVNDNENENENENEKLKKNKMVKDANIKKLIEEPKEIKSLNWLDKNKFKEILTIIDSNKFGHKNKIGDFKYIDIKDLVNNIKDNTISEIDAKKHLNTLNIIKNSEIKHKRLISGQKELLNLFDDLSDTILPNKTLMPSKEENEKLKEKENENENENEDDEHKDDDYYYEYEDDKTIDQNKIIKEKNDDLDKIIDKSKPFQDQIKFLKKNRKFRRLLS